MMLRGYPEANIEKVSNDIKPLFAALERATGIQLSGPLQWMPTANGRGMEAGAFLTGVQNLGRVEGASPEFMGHFWYIHELNLADAVVDRLWRHHYVEGQNRRFVNPHGDFSFRLQFNTEMATKGKQRGAAMYEDIDLMRAVNTHMLAVLLTAYRRASASIDLVPRDGMVQISLKDEMLRELNAILDACVIIHNATIGPDAALREAARKDGKPGILEEARKHLPEWRAAVAAKFDAASLDVIVNQIFEDDHKAYNAAREANTGVRMDHIGVISQRNYINAALLAIAVVEADYKTEEVLKDPRVILSKPRQPDPKVENLFVGQGSHPMRVDDHVYFESYPWQLKGAYGTLRPGPDQHPLRGGKHFQVLGINVDPTTADLSSLTVLVEGNQQLNMPAYLISSVD